MKCASLKSLAETALEPKPQTQRRVKRTGVDIRFNLNFCMQSNPSLMVERALRAFIPGPENGLDYNRRPVRVNTKSGSGGLVTPPHIC
jgi:hypothetical protein